MNLYSELIDRYGYTKSVKIYRKCIDAQILTDYACARLDHAQLADLRSRYYAGHETIEASNRLLMTHYTKTANALQEIMHNETLHLWVEIEGRSACYEWSEAENCFIFADGEESPFFAMLDSETQERILQEVQQSGTCEF